MRVLFTWFVLLFSIVLLLSSCSAKTDDNTSESTDNSSTEDISISSSTSSSSTNNANVTFGQTFQYQVTTTGTYSGTITYSLSNHPEGMTISSSGLIEWTPTKASQITTHSNIKITLTTASDYVLTQTYDLTVTGTCVSGNVLSIWTGDQRSSTDSSKLLGNITTYTDNASSGDVCGVDNASDCTAENNYQYNQPISSSENLNIGPTPSATKGNMFFYNQYDNTTHTYLFWMFGKGGAEFDDGPNIVKLDLFVANNESSDDKVQGDEPAELSRESQSESSGLYSSSYEGRYEYYTKKSDGGVIGPFSGSNYRILVDLRGFSTISPSDNLTLGNLATFTFWSTTEIIDGLSLDLEDNESNEDPVDNFTVGYSTTLDCSN